MFFWNSLAFLIIQRMLAIWSLVPLPFLESLFGGSSRGVQLLVYPWPKTGPPLLGMVVLFNRAHSFGRDAHGAVREEGDTCLASQISQINPGNQWGDRCRNQIAVTSYHLFLIPIVSVSWKKKKKKKADTILPFLWRFCYADCPFFRTNLCLFPTQSGKYYNI